MRLSSASYARQTLRLVQVPGLSLFIHIFIKLYKLNNAHKRISALQKFRSVNFGDAEINGCIIYVSLNIYNCTHDTRINPSVEERTKVFL